MNLILVRISGTCRFTYPQQPPPNSHTFSLYQELPPDRWELTLTPESWVKRGKPDRIEIVVTDHVT